MPFKTKSKMTLVLPVAFALSSQVVIKSMSNLDKRVSVTYHPITKDSREILLVSTLLPHDMSSTADFEPLQQVFCIDLIPKHIF